MQRLLYLLILLSAGVRAEQTYTLEILVTKIGAFCGGRALTAEQTAAMRIPTPFPSKHLSLKAGSSNKRGLPVLFEGTTDAQGLWKLQVPAGTYCVIDDSKLRPLLIPKNSKYYYYNHACMKEEHRTCDLTIEVKDQTQAKLTYPSYCFGAFPCVRYSGPRPP